MGSDDVIKGLGGQGAKVQFLLLKEVCVLSFKIIWNWQKGSFNSLFAALKLDYSTECTFELVLVELMKTSIFFKTAL